LLSVTNNTLEIRELTRRYGSGLAVDCLSFEVPAGHVTGLLGPNGAGTSTTMRLVLGLDRPTAGSALVTGRPCGGLKRPLREVGAMLEPRSFHPGPAAQARLTALGASSAMPAARVGEVLAITGLTKAAGKRAGKFSLGMAQRLGIAAAMLGDPGVIMLDEPVNGLNPEGIRWIRGAGR
jgi:ABC-2 type transport system ATP-binding protein